MALTHAEMAAGLAAAPGHPTAFVDVAPVDLQHYLLQTGMDSWQAKGLLEDYVHYQRGEAAAVVPGIQQATGQPPRNFAASAHDYAETFRYYRGGRLSLR